MQSQLFWAGHVVCMKGHRLPKKLFYGELFQDKRFHGGHIREVEFTDCFSAGVSPSTTSVLDITLNNLIGEAPALAILGMQRTLSLPLFLDSLWHWVVAPDRVPSIGQIEQTVCKQMTDVKLWLLYSNTWKHLTLYKKELRLV